MMAGGGGLAAWPLRKHREGEMRTLRGALAAAGERQVIRDFEDRICVFRDRRDFEIGFRRSFFVCLFVEGFHRCFMIFDVLYFASF